METKVKNPTHIGHKQEGKKEEVIPKCPGTTHYKTAHPLLQDHFPPAYPIQLPSFHCVADRGELLQILR